MRDGKKPSVGVTGLILARPIFNSRWANSVWSRRVVSAKAHRVIAPALCLGPEVLRFSQGQKALDGLNRHAIPRFSSRTATNGHGQVVLVLPRIEHSTGLYGTETRRYEVQPRDFTP